MVVIMSGKLVVRKELAESFVDFERNGMSCRADLAVATQDQLAILKDLGVDVFEPEAVKSEKPK
jgi:hypothetical protein